MADPRVPAVAIVDYGMGNLFSVKHACEHVGLRAEITSDKRAVLSADAVILPGVGAFGDAMKTLGRLDLIGPLRESAASPRPFVGICLGLQLLMDESAEFGTHRGLGIVRGTVVRFDNTDPAFGNLKVPQVGWNRIFKAAENRRSEVAADVWSPWPTSPIAGVPEGAFMYFVHSYYVVPEDAEPVLTVTRYGNVEFCSALQCRNIFACQFHPERSGALGLRIYRNLASALSAEG